MSPESKVLSRRTILKASAAVLVTGMLPKTNRVLAEAPLNRTQDQILGPFYPIMSKPDPSGDLTRVPSGTGRARGQPLIVTGRVLDPFGKPIKGANIEIWQANSEGRYAHPDDTNPAPLDPNFQGFGAVITGTDGRYRFKTTKPSAYPITPTRTRPAHIHFNVRGSHDELITQMYFEGDPYNEKDPFLQSAFDPEALIVKLTPPTILEPDYMVGVFDIVFRG